MKRIRLVTNIISLVLMAGYAIALAILWKGIPQTVAVHFDAAGRADAYGNKSFLLVEFLIMTGIFLVLAVTEHFPSAWNLPVKVTAANRGRLYTIEAVMLGLLKILMILLFISTGIRSIVTGAPMWPVYLILGLMAAVVIGGIICSIVMK